jgi:predicted SAM-dependent methyltransferase
MKKIILNVLRPFYRQWRTFSGRQKLKKAAKKNPCRIVVGASGIADDSWTATEETYLNLLQTEDWQEFFAENKIDVILAEHVWEHLTLAQGAQAAQNCFDYLKDGGYVRCAVPDGFHTDAAYIDYVKPGGTGNGADDHKVLYNYRTFAEIFSKAGFQVECLEYFDENGQFHASDWQPEDGLIRRSKRFDPRNQGGKLTAYTSIIIDATKKANADSLKKKP